MGRALCQALPELAGPYGRGFTGRDGERTFDAVLLAVPDAQIASAAALIEPGPLVGHCSGASRLDVLGSREAFSVHPLMTVTERGATFGGAWAAIAGSTSRAEAVARGLTERLGMHPFAVADADRAAYHAAASIAANFLVTVEDFADRLLATTGAPRAALVPLVRAAIENWATRGGPEALTGPVARGDAETVARQRAAVEHRLPEQLALFDELCAATRRLAGRG